MAIYPQNKRTSDSPVLPEEMHLAELGGPVIDDFIFQIKTLNYPFISPCNKTRETLLNTTLIFSLSAPDL